jgi:VCBS repeat-containing protein
MLRSVSVALAICALSVLLSACGGGGNDAPIASNTQVTVVEDTAITVTLVDTDPDGDALTVAVVTPPTNGDLVFTGTSPLQFKYTPHANVSGTDSFTYRLSDGDKESNLGTVALGIAAVNDAPLIQPTLTADQDVSVTATLITDVENDTFTSTIVTAPTHGTLTVDASNPGKFTYQPEAGYSGADSADLKAVSTAADGTTVTVTQTLAITVRPKPSGVADPTPAALSVTINTAPWVGTAAVNAGGSIRYTPATPFVGTTSLEYEVREGERSFKVSGALPAGESIDTLTVASSAPVVFYRTQESGRLYRVDLSQPGVAQPVEVRDLATDELASEAIRKSLGAATTR